MEKINCQICGFPSHQLTTHIIKKHNMTTQEYKEKFPGHELISEYRRNINKNKSISPFSIEFYRSKYETEEEAKQALESFLENRRNNLDRSKSHFCKEYWINKGYSEEEASKILSERSKHDLNFYISKYGEEEGAERYKKANTAYKGTTQYYKDQGLSDEEIKKIFKKTKDTQSIDYFIRKYGKEEGSKLYNDRKNNLDKSNIYFCKEYWIKRGMTEEEASIHISNQNKHNLDFYINKYGEEEGKKKYDEWKSKTNGYLVRNYNSGGVSKESQRIIKDIYKYLCNKDVKIKEYIYYDKDNSEKEIIANGNRYFLDFYIELENGKKYTIEYNGDYWHCNPEKYSESEYVSFFKKDVLVKDIWDRDNKRKMDLESVGINVIVVWESEWKRDKHTVKNKILEEINKNYE